MSGAFNTQNESFIVEEEEEEKNDGSDDSETANLLNQNIDDYSMSTDEFVSTVEYILGQKDDIRISKNYDDEIHKKKRKSNYNLSKSIKCNAKESNDSNEKSEIRSDKASNDANKYDKEVDYSRFFLFAKSNNNKSLNDDLSISSNDTLEFPSATPTAKRRFTFNSSTRSTPITGQQKANTPLNNIDFTFYSSCSNEKSPIKRRIKLDLSKKNAYTPEERRSKSKQISKFFNSNKESQIDGLFTFCPNQTSSDKSDRSKRKKGSIYQQQNDSQVYSNPNYQHHPTNNFNHSKNSPSIDQSNQLTEVFDFEINEDINFDDKPNKEYSYRKALNSSFSPYLSKNISEQAETYKNSENQNRNASPKNKCRKKNVQFIKGDF